MKNASDYEPEVNRKRAGYMRLIHVGWPVAALIVYFVYYILGAGLTVQNLILFAIWSVAAIAMTVCNYYLYWNIQN